MAFEVDQSQINQPGRLTVLVAIDFDQAEVPVR
jgi:hypothetical protein